MGTEPGFADLGAAFDGSCVVVWRWAHAHSETLRPWWAGWLVPGRGTPLMGLSAQQQPFHQGFLHVQTVFRFVPNHRLGAVDHLSTDFFASVRW